ncbi:MAG: hypothetical protein JST16_16425 [Bdellovibrionales bacterium]|nr:hypothetical protein [Bdellovibrionales bacterium]
MKNSLLILGLMLVTVGLSACSSSCGNRSTASEDDVQAFKPTPSEVRH